MGDSYRPRVRSRSPRRGFTGSANSGYRDRDFQFDHPRHLPARTQENDPQSYRDRGRRGDNFHPGSRSGSRGGRARGGRNDREPFRRTSYVPLPAHNRPILNVDFREKTPELLPGMVTTGGFETGEGEDNGEEPMEMSENEESFTNEDPATLVEPVPEKLAGPIAETNSDGPKIEVVEGQEFVEADKKRMDVIQMIRQSKAKLAAEREKEAKKDSVAANDDFISLNFGDEGKSRLESDSEDESGRKKRKLSDNSKAVQSPRIYQDAQSGKQFSHREHLHGPYVPKEPLDEGPPGIGTLSRAAKLPPPPGPSRNIRAALRKRPIDPYSSEEMDDYKPNSDDDHDPENLQHEHRDVPQTRKRKYDEISKGKSLDGNIKPELRPKAGIDHIPWARDHSKTLHMTSWLHKEIIDFAEYIKPRPYEHAVRRYVIQRLRYTINKLWKDTDVRVFGSFAAELYLPTSDVDLVVVSQTYALRDIPKYSTKNYLYKVASVIRSNNLAERRNVQVISNAKVPIIKYIDEATGLHVDISFENKSGLVANKTFKDWREQYPCLPVLLTLVKHFLAMRNLNEVYQGGIGSFTLSCLLVSLLQQLPSVVSGKLDPGQNLGIILLEFLDLYGNRFNTSRVGIRVDSSRPSYFRREDLHPMPTRPKLQDGFLLVIQDPNNADNNISRSSFLIKTVLACFAEAYAALTKQMATLDRMDFEARKGRSLLGLLIGGDYTEMEEQRKLLRGIYVDRVGKEEDLVDPIYVPAVPPLPNELPPPPPPPPPPPAPPEREAGNRDQAVWAGRSGQLQAMDIDPDDDSFEDVLEMIKRNRPKPHAQGSANGSGNGTGRKDSPITLD